MYSIHHICETYPLNRYAIYPPPQSGISYLMRINFLGVLYLTSTSKPRTWWEKVLIEPCYALENGTSIIPETVEINQFNKFIKDHQQTSTSSQIEYGTVHNSSKHWRIQLSALKCRWFNTRSACTVEEVLHKNVCPYLIVKSSLAMMF